MVDLEREEELPAGSLKPTSKRPRRRNSGQDRRQWRKLETAVDTKPSSASVPLDSLMTTIPQPKQVSGASTTVDSSAGTPKGTRLPPPSSKQKKKKGSKGRRRNPSGTAVDALATAGGVLASTSQGVVPETPKDPTEKRKRSEDETPTSGSAPSRNSCKVNPERGADAKMNRSSGSFSGERRGLIIKNANSAAFAGEEVGKVFGAIDSSICKAMSP